MATWPPIIDDDGSGTTGTPTDYALFQLIKTYIDQSDTAIAPVSGSFVVTDMSGAGLAFTSNGFYIKVGKLIAITMQVIYPATANGAAARWGGLPFPIANNGALYQGYGAVPIRTWGQTGAQILEVFAAATGAPVTNATLTSSNTTLHGVYLTP
jgi:hypothetical protein